MLMVQNNTQLPMKNTKVKGPPPVPPRPNQSVVAEALAKTRRAVAESRANFIRSQSNSREKQRQIPKAKILDRSSSTDKSNSLPKQNGLARVKSFIRDVISDRSSSSDERKSSGHNSRRSSSDSSSIAGVSIKKSNESLNSRAVKTCKQILVRSLSTSNKLDQDKCKVNKSSSFAEKTTPVRKAPPPPISPKPKLKPMKQLSMRRNTYENNVLRSTPDITLYSSPIDAKLCQESEAPYATVEEMNDFDNRLHNNKVKQETIHNDKQMKMLKSPMKVNNNSLERKTSRVTEMLISEIIASRNNNENEENTVIDKGKFVNNLDRLKEIDTNVGNVLPRDMNNHEILIYELQSMRSQSSELDYMEVEKSDTYKCESDSDANYARSSESSGNSEDQAYAYILDDDLKTRLRRQFKAISTMSLPGLPPLPKSLSGFADAIHQPQDDYESPETPEKPADFEGQLEYLKKEMANLRQLDLSLLSELWSLSEAMSSWRRQLERGPRLRPAPPPPPPPPHYLRT